MSTITRIVAGTFLLSALAITGCNTVKGMGDDIYAVGDTSQRALNEAFYGNPEGPTSSHGRTYYGD